MSEPPHPEVDGAEGSAFQMQGGIGDPQLGAVSRAAICSRGLIDRREEWPAFDIVVRIGIWAGTTATQLT
jgi:hypothetical protein